MLLSLDQQTAFHAQGFVHLEQFASACEIRDICQIYDGLFASRAGRDAGDQFDLSGSDEDDQPALLPQLMNPAKYAPELAHLEFRGAAFRLAQCLLGASVEAGDEHAICKPARIGVATPWHQDQAYWDPAYDYEALSVWVPLQPVDAESGCLHFIPGSHLQGVVPHQSIRGDRTVHGLETRQPVADSLAVACPLTLGGCTIHHCRTLHFAGANHSSLPRRAYILTFRLPPVPRSVPYEFPWLTQRQTLRQSRVEQAGA